MSTPPATAAPTLRPLGAPRPGALLLVLLLAWAVLGVAASFGLLPAAAWWGSGAALVLAAFGDLVALRRLPTPDAVRRIAETLAIGMPTTVRLALDPGRARLRAWVHDLHPGGWEAQDMPRRLALKPGTLSEFEYRLRPTARGDFAFEGVQLLVDSPLRLWRQSRVSGQPQTVRVFPNFAPLTRLAMAGAERATRMVGAHMTRRRGEGTDFRQLREYRVGDSLRQVDWKATARSRKLISREYQDEKNQQLVMLIDTGRRMMAREDELGHFDHVLNASLVVSYLALRQGDGVGLFAAGGDSRWVAPQRGMAAIDTLLRASYDLQPRAVATDYLAAATELSLRQRRRALVMLVTNVRDEDIDDLLAAVRLLQKRHLVCVASLRETSLDDALDDEVHDLQGAIHAGAVARYMEQRAAAHDALRSHRVMVLDVTSDELPAALVERYLAVKRDGVL